MHGWALPLIKSSWAGGGGLAHTHRIHTTTHTDTHIRTHTQTNVRTHWFTRASTHARTHTHIHKYWMSISIIILKALLFRAFNYYCIYAIVYTAHWFDLLCIYSTLLSHNCAQVWPTLNSAHWFHLLCKDVFSAASISAAGYNVAITRVPVDLWDRSN